MKKFLLVLVVVGIANMVYGYDWDGIDVPADAGDGMEWELQDSISDDFNYTFNETNSLTNFGDDRWYNFYHNGWDGPGTTYWQYNHVSVDGSDLVMRTSRNSSTTKLGVPGINAACITSNSQVHYPVFVEASISVADIVLASDVWLLSPDDTQEIDIIECYGGDSYFETFIHLSHHSFIRVPFTDYQPRDKNSWWQKSGVSSWGQYCWNGGSRRYVRVGVHWVGSKYFKYYVDGELVRVLYNNAFATKKGSTWYYTYPTMTGGVLNFGADGYQSVTTYRNESTYSFQTLQDASAVSSTSVIDPYEYQGTAGFTKSMDIIINMESQDWHVLADPPRVPSDADLLNDAKNTAKVDWIRVYKPVTASSINDRENEVVLSVVPNPFINEIIIQSESLIKQVALYQLNGVLLQSEEVGEMQHTINTNHLKSGAHIIKIQLSDGKIITRKVVKM